MNEVAIELQGTFLSVKPALVSILGPVLTFNKKVSEFNKKQRKRVMTSVATAIYEYRQESDELWVPAGALDKICGALKRASMPYTVNRVLKCSEEERKLDLSKFKASEHRPEQLGMLKQIISNTHTICKAPPGAGKSYLIGTICNLYPNARIVITTDSTDVITTLKEYLLNRCGEPIGQIGDGQRSEERITVCTLQSIRKLLRKPHILIVDEVHVVGTDNYAQACLETGSEAFKIVGLSATPFDRGDGADLVVEGVCGPLRFVSSYQDSVKHGSVVPIEVEYYECTKGPTWNETNILRNQADKDRKAIWSNVARNELIAKVIGQERRITPDDQILIYTERVEHALYIAKLLPDFVVVTGESDEEKTADFKALGLITNEDQLCNPKKRDEYMAKFESGEIKYAICSKVWQKGVNFPNLRVLLRADAGASDITNVQAGGRASRVTEGKTKAKIIDIDDVFNKSYAYRFKLRLKEYEANGWPAVRKTI